MATNQTLLRLCRKTHLYFGLLIAPSLLFFAFTGAVQVLSLHEAAGSSYEPPAWLAKLGQIHKNQTNILPPKRPQGANPGVGKKESAPNQMDVGRPPQSATPPTNTAVAGSTSSQTATSPDASAKPTHEARAGGASPSTLASKQKQHLPLKLFFLLVSAGLFTSTLTGIYMAYKYERGKVLVTVLLGLGLVTPIFLLRF